MGVGHSDLWSYLHQKTSKVIHEIHLSHVELAGVAEGEYWLVGLRSWVSLLFSE